MGSIRPLAQSASEVEVIPLNISADSDLQIIHSTVRGYTWVKLAVDDNNGVGNAIRRNAGDAVLQVERDGKSIHNQILEAASHVE